MMGERQAGYTIVEVTLFLAISGLLFLIAVLGTGATIRSVRFTDSGRTLAAFVQKQYDDIISGVNPRGNDVTCTTGVVSPGTQTPGTSNCLLIGKLLVIPEGQSRLSVYDVLGTQPANVNFSLPDSQLITQFQPTLVLTSGVFVYDIPWQAQVVGSKRLSDDQAVDGLLLIRSPSSSRIVSYTYKVTSPLDANLSTVVADPANITKPTNFCIRNADGLGPPAVIAVSGGATQAAVGVVFDRTMGDCDGA